MKTFEITIYHEDGPTTKETVKADGVNFLGDWIEFRADVQFVAAYADDQVLKVRVIQEQEVATLEVDHDDSA